MTHSPCNRILWNRQSSKTRAGMPCLGCTEPEFPFFDLAPGTVFKTQTVMGVPKDLPPGVDKTRLHQADRARPRLPRRPGPRRTSSSSDRAPDTYQEDRAHAAPYKHSTFRRSVASKAISTCASTSRTASSTNAWTQAELFRGFEIILRDKDPQAGLVVTPRACGICGASHLTCAAWALDTAWQTEVPRNAILARNLGQITESLQSLPRHSYGLFMIDYDQQEVSRKSAFYEEAVKRWAPFTGTSTTRSASPSRASRSRSTRCSAASGRIRATWCRAA